MKKSICLSIISVVFLFIRSVSGTPADSTIKSAKFAMIKATVKLYATDTALLKGKAKPDCSNVNDIASLKTCSEILPGVSRKITEFNKADINSVNDLTKFKQTIIAGVNATKDRKKLSGYNDFLNELDNIITEATKRIEQSPTTDIAATTNVDTSEAGLQGQEVDSNSSVSEEPKNQNKWVMLSIVLSILAIGISLFAILRKQKKSRGNRRSGEYKESKPATDGVSKEVSTKQLDDLSLKINDLTNRIGSLENELKKIKTPGNVAQPSSSGKSSETESNQQSQKVVKIAKYAKNADGDSFDKDNLTDKSDDKRIYELLIEGTKGTYKVTNNREAQLFALEDPNTYLRKACNYTSLADANSFIKTIEDGIIELRGGKWVITKKAEIDFASSWK